MTNVEPLVVRAGEGRTPEPIVLAGRDILVKVTGEDTGGAYTAGILEARPMSGPPLHLQIQEDEWFYVLKGEFTFQVADRRFTACPGTSVLAPRNTPHTWQNFTDETAEALTMVTPPNPEAFSWEVLTILGPPLS